MTFAGVVTFDSPALDLFGSLATPIVGRAQPVLPGSRKRVRASNQPGHSNVCMQVASMCHDYGVPRHVVECTGSSVSTAAT